MEKHLPYFKLIEELNKKECPICKIIKEEIDLYCQNLFYEYINDVSFRKAFRENFGFCNFHNYLLISYRDVLGISILLKDLFEILQKRRKNSFFKKKTKCLLCNLEEDISKRYISIIADFKEDKEFREKYLNSCGLCIPHYDMLKKYCRTIPTYIVEHQKEMEKYYLNYLEKDIDKLNYKGIEIKNFSPIYEEAAKFLWGYKYSYKKISPNVPIK